MRLPRLPLSRPRRWLLVLYLASVAFATVQRGVLARSNNFSVFRSASVNLLAGRDLYAAHPEQHADFYKYSPTFALLFIPLAKAPFVLALLVWNLLNVFLLWYALTRLLPEGQATKALGLIYLEVLFATQYAQSNALVTALMILGFVAFERGRELRAALAIALDACIKIFPLATLALVPLYPRRLRFALIFGGVSAALVALPLLAVPPHELIAQYRSWRAIEALDTLNRGYSLMQYLYMWFHADWPLWPVQLAGTALVVSPLALGRTHWTDPHFRRLLLASLLVYVLLFNHQSERATFVIAYTGIIVWYVSSARSPLRDAVIGVTLLTMLVHDVDVVPAWVKTDILIPYRVKGIPCLLAWVVIEAELLGLLPRAPRLERAEMH